MKHASTLRPSFIAVVFFKKLKLPIVFKVRCVKSGQFHHHQFYNTIIFTTLELPKALVVKQAAFSSSIVECV